jgi:inosine-uridine nucleoside N-ribohydrolase
MSKTKADKAYKVMSFRICDICDFKVVCVADGNKKPMNRSLSTEDKEEHKKYHRSWLAKLKRRQKNADQAQKKLDDFLKESNKSKVFNFWDEFSQT